MSGIYAKYQVQIMLFSLACVSSETHNLQRFFHPGGGGVVPYIGYIGMCRAKGQVVCALRLRCIVDSTFSRWRRRSRNFAGYMLYFSIDTVLSLDRFSRFHKLISV